MNDETLQLLQQRIGSTSIGPSTARGMGPKGTIQVARSFLTLLDLSIFAVADKAAFERVIDTTTKDFKAQLPVGAQHWGASRKFLNIFLRSVVYNKYLCAHFRLDCIEPWLEVPLDSHVATGLMSEPGGDQLPKWRTVKGLQPPVSKVYQEFARVVSEQKGVHRVHLDLYYWRRDAKPSQAIT